jgi:hypothetical protein
MREGRVQVATAAEYAETLRSKHNERAARLVEEFDIVLDGLCGHGKFSFPYPGPYGRSGQAVALRRDQAAHLVVELLKKLSPDGELPQDKAELGDFIADVIREGSQT